MRRRKAFTLIEVLISIVLISLVLLALYKSLAIQRNSNRHLHDYLKHALDRDRAAMVFYNDLLSSDGKLKLIKGKYDRLCIDRTSHSLYGLPVAKVCWLVLRNDRELVRVEGNGYHLPLRSDSRAEVDRVMGPMSLFDIYHRDGKILVVMQKEGSKPYSFLLETSTQSSPPAKASHESNKTGKRDGNRTKAPHPKESP